MVRRRWTNWQWVFATVVAVIVVGLLTDIATWYFVRQVNAQAAEAVAIQFVRQWDNFVMSAAGHLSFQKTIDIYDELLDPKIRESFLRQSGDWVDEMRKAAGANFWVVMDADSQPVVVLPPTKSGLPSLHPLWKSPVENQYMAAIFQGANSESALLGVGTDLVIDGKKRGELWLLYWLDKVCQQLNRSLNLSNFELATLKGKVIFKAKQHELTDPNLLYISADSEQLPLRFTISIPSGRLSENASLLRLLYWFFLGLIALIITAIMRHRQQISDGELAIKLTEIFNSLSERFLETRDEAKVLQELAEAITREFRFPIAIVFRMDMQSGKFKVAGYAPRRLLSEILNRYGNISSLTLPEQVIQRLQTGNAYISSSCHEFFEPLPKEAVQTLQNMLQLCWGALLFAKGKPVAAILTGTSKEQLSREELQALELVRQQAAMLITIIASWEEREKALEQLIQFQNALRRLNKELAKEDELTNELELIDKKLDKILVEAIECIKDALKVDGAYVVLIDSEGKPEIKASLGISDKVNRAIKDFLARSLSDLATTITITDVSQASELGSLQKALLEEGILSLLSVPIIHNDRLIGRLNASFNRPRKFAENEVELMQTIASLLAFAVALREVKEQIRHSEKEFRSLFENAVVGIYRSTPEGRFLMANETLARINGYDSVEELMALDIPSQIYLNPEDRERFRKLMVERGFVSDFRYPIKRKDGSIGWVTKWSRAVKDDNGNVLYYEGFVLDITEKVKLEQRLNALQATARSLITRLDIDNIVQVAVAEISRLYPDSAVLVFRYREESDVFVLERSNEEAKDLLRALRLSIGATLKRQGFPFLENRLWSGESILISDLNTTVGSSIKELTELGYNAIFLRGVGDSSHLWGMIGICCKGEDFTQQDAAFLNSFCDYLSIAVRNASLFQQVQQAYDELRSIQERMLEQERLRALGQIASGIAHDINNALVPIQGFAEILLEHNDPTVRNAAEVIFKSASDITATVQRMREFYRMRSSEDLLEPVDLNAICKDALMMTRPRWFNMPRERGIVIEPQLELSDDLPPLSGMPSEIRQAIVNLIINAVDAMPEGGTLTIRTYRKDRRGRVWVVVEVSDTGVGMDEETKRRATEPFFTTKGERGSGLGLPAVYGTVQRHEGFMESDSEPGQGTTVRLWFPSNVVQTIELPAGEIPSLRLLVIDDEPSVRETLALMLRKGGHVVATAADGEEGLELLQAAQLQGNPFNAVITDLGMPKLDGLSVARKIKALAPETPVILLSGWGFRISAEEMRDVIDGVLTKPVTYQQICRTLNQIWKKRMALSN
ncbi:MAG: ATP-binding protein [Candidatus Fervidibacter sp.]|uniref:ATP-binding protein n=1 Tax=Candidatus Fervidibacter sp. TaxID=3100871 RepID=UPI00404AE7CC